MPSQVGGQAGAHLAVGLLDQGCHVTLVTSPEPHEVRGGQAVFTQYVALEDCQKGSQISEDEPFPRAPEHPAYDRTHRAISLAVCGTAGAEVPDSPLDRRDAVRMPEQRHLERSPALFGRIFPDDDERCRMASTSDDGEGLRERRPPITTWAPSSTTAMIPLRRCGGGESSRVTGEAGPVGRLSGRTLCRHASDRAHGYCSPRQPSCPAWRAP